MNLKPSLRVRAPKRRTRTYISVALAVSVIAAVAADRLTALWIEDKAAGAIQAALGTAGAPSVHVSGFPVLPDVLTGEVHQVDVNADGIPAAGDRPVRITHLHLVMDGVRSYDRTSSAHANTARATAFISYADLSSALGVQVTPDAEPGRIDATADVPLIGPVTVSATIAASGDDTIAFQDPRVTGDLPPGAASAVTAVLSEPLTLQGLPRGLKLTHVTADAQGVQADLAGSDVNFTTYADADTPDTRHSA